MLPSRLLKVAALLAALFPAFARAEVETLSIQIGKDKTILDTVTILMDPAILPVIPHPDGADWADIELDTNWSDSTGRHVRHNHSFAISMDTLQGYGNDFLFMDADDSASSYSASVSFNFPGKTRLQYVWDGVHLQDYPAAKPNDKTAFLTGYASPGKVNLFAGDTNLTPGQTAKLLTRKPGGQMSGLIAPRTAKAWRADSWLIGFAPGTALEVPAGAKAVRIYDVQGRLQWESRNLPAGARLELPSGLPRQALRIRWQSG